MDEVVEVEMEQLLELEHMLLTEILILMEIMVVAVAVVEQVLLDLVVVEMEQVHFLLGYKQLVLEKMLEELII